MSAASRSVSIRSGETKRACIWCIGNHIAGKEMSQKRKKAMKFLVSIPADADSPLATIHQELTSHSRSYSKDLRMFITDGHIARSMTNIQFPPMLAWTPYQMLLSVSHNSPVPHIVVNLPSHSPSIEGAPQTSIKAKTGTIYDRKRDVKDSSWPRIQHDEWRHNSIAYPDTDPRLPPRQTELDHGRGNHPSTRRVQGMSKIQGGEAGLTC